MRDNITLEILLVSIKTEYAKESILRRLETSMLLDVDELELLNQYKKLYEDIGKIPTPSILVNENTIYKDIPIINSEEDLINYTSIFLKNRLKSNISSKIINSIQELNNNTKPDNTIIDDITNEIHKLSITNDIIDDVVSTDSVVEIYNKQDLSKRYKTGLSPIDETCGGIPEGSVTIVMGGTGSFKTMTTTNICYNAMQEGKNICYLSLEVVQSHMYFNLVSRHSMSSKFSIRIPHKDIKNKSLSEELYKQFEIVSNDLNDSVKGKCIVIDEQVIPSFDIAGFEKIITKVDKQLIEKTGHGVDILVVDHAQLLKFSGSVKYNDPYAIVNYYVSWLRQQSLNFLGQNRAISVIIVSQTSRNGIDYANKHGGQYLLTHAAEANELERSASYVISVYANDMTRSSNELMVQLLKSRNSETMMEPATVKMNPKYYMVGSGMVITDNTQIFNNTDVSISLTDNDTFQGLDLNAKLEDIFGQI